jgi:hypothetical protein
MEINRTEQFDALLDLIHDWFFDVNSTFGSQEGDRMQLDFRINARRFLDNDDTDRVLVTVFNIRAIEIYDSERVGFYDLNKITFDEKTQAVSFVTGIPLTFKLHVSHLRIGVDKIG